MNETTTDATAIVAPLWRYKWLILAVGVLVAAGTYLIYSGGTSTYQTATQVNLAAGAEEQGIATPPPETKRRAKRFAVASPAVAAANVVNSPLVRQTVVARLKSLHTPASEVALRGTVAARAGENTQIITIVAQATDPVGSALLANTTANTFVLRQNTIFTQGIQGALLATRKQLASVELALAAAGPNAPAANLRAPKGRKSNPNNRTSDILQEASLKTKITQLEGQLGVTSIRQLGLANGRVAQVLATDPKQNALFGFVIGIFLAAVAAYVLNRFDRRLRTLAGIESVFEMQILAALPSVRRPIVLRDGHLLPSGALSEPLRRLHTTLRLGETLNGAQATRPRSILFVSPDAADGKSTVAAGLALVQRDAGEQVSLIEADFRRPVQGRLLGTALTGGLLEVLSGELTFEEALQPVEGAPEQRGVIAQAEAHPGIATLVDSRSTGTLSVLLGEEGVANPPAVLADPAMASLVRAAAEEFDHVLIDAPPPLMVSDAMPLLAAVDGIVLVARIGHTREASAKRLVEVLARTSSAPLLGVVANDVTRADMKRYGFSLGYPHRGWLGRLSGR